MPGRRRTRRLGLAVAAVVLVAGCGESSAPADAVPALGDALERVDDAIVEGRYDDARSELDGLVADTTDAQESGDLGASEADRILAAAAKVSSALPAEDEPEPDPEPAPEEQPSEEPSEEPGGDTGGEEAGSDEEAEKEQEELDKEQEKLEKEQEKLEEEQQKEEEKAEDEGGGGNGDSSENGPDDGEGS